MKELYQDEAARGMLSDEERQQAAVKGLQIQSQIARACDGDNRWTYSRGDLERVGQSQSTAASGGSR
eukprot:6393166-Prorocentrum_lima.AAC.1